MPDASLRALFMQAPQPSLVCARAGEVIALNAHAAKLFDPDAAQLDALTPHAAHLLALRQNQRALTHWRIRGELVPMTTEVRVSDDALMLTLERLDQLFEPIARDSAWSAALSAMQVSMFAVDAERRVISLLDPGRPERATYLDSLRGAPYMVAYKDVTATLHDGVSLDAAQIHARALAGEPLRGLIRSNTGVFNGHIAPLQLIDGQRVGLIGVTANITAQVEAAQRAAHEVALLRAATAQLNDLILILRMVEDDAQIVFANEALARLTGRDHASLRDAPLSIFVEAPDALRAVLDAMRQRAPLRCELERGALTFELDLVPLDPGTCGQGCWAMVARDITQQKLLNAELRAAQRMESVGLLTGGLAHDFNNVLTSIVGFVEFGIESARQLACSPDADAELTQALLADLEEVHHAALRGGDLVKRMLAFSRQRFVQQGVFDVTASLISMERMLRRLLPSTIQLAIKLPRHPCATRGSAIELEQVIMNLVINARDAMPRGGQLAITLSRHGDACSIQVKDSGSGIPADVLPHIFEPFFTTKEPGRGTGLGLSMAREIVERMGGALRVETQPGVGSTFTVELPMYLAPTALLDAEHSLASSGRGERVLVVEDDASIRQLTRRMLDAAGYQTLVVRSAELALELCQSDPHAFDAVITDIVLGGMSGWELATQLLSLRPGLPILLCSGYAPKPPPELASLQLPLLPKPFCQETLLPMLRALLDGSSVVED